MMLGKIALPLFQLIILVISIPFQLMIHVINILRFDTKKKIPAPKVIVITGATSGIGKGLALHYAKRGVTLGLIGRNEERLEEIENECIAKGAEVRCGKIDVTNGKAIAAFILELDNDLEIDLIIANAGISSTVVGYGRDIVKATRSLFSVNVDGVFNTILPIIPSMKQRKRGQIVFVSSLAGFGAIPISCPYSATKAAIKTYGTALRGVLHRDGISVNVVCPGFVETPMTDIDKKWRPFMISLDECIQKIVEGLERDIPLIAFPWQLYTLSWLTAAIPDSIRDFLACSRLTGLIDYLPPRSSEKKR